MIRLTEMQKDRDLGTSSFDLLPKHLV